MLAAENYPILTDIRQHEWSPRGRLPVPTMFSLTFLALAHRGGFTKSELARSAGVSNLHNRHPVNVFLQVFSENGKLDRSEPTNTRTYATTPELTAFANAYTALRVDLAADLTKRTRSDILNAALGIFALANRLPTISSTEVMGHLTNLPSSNVAHNGVEAFIAATGLSRPLESAMGALLLTASKPASGPPITP